MARSRIDGTTQIYLHADLELKERAPAKTSPLGVPTHRYRPDDKLLAFLRVNYAEYNTPKTQRFADTPKITRNNPERRMAKAVNADVFFYAASRAAVCTAFWRLFSWT